MLCRKCVTALGPLQLNQRYQGKCLALSELASMLANGPGRGKLILYTINFLIARRNGVSKSSFRVFDDETPEL